MGYYVMKVMQCFLSEGFTTHEMSSEEVKIAKPEEVLKTALAHDPTLAVEAKRLGMRNNLFLLHSNEANDGLVCSPCKYVSTVLKSIKSIAKIVSPYALSVAESIVKNSDDVKACGAEMWISSWDDISLDVMLRWGINSSKDVRVDIFVPDVDDMLYYSVSKSNPLGDEYMLSDSDIAAVMKEVWTLINISLGFFNKNGGGRDLNTIRVWMGMPINGNKNANGVHVGIRNSYHYMPPSPSGTEYGRADELTREEYELLYFWLV